jgi:hypothetical protein
MKRKTLQWFSSLAIMLSVCSVWTACDNDDDDDKYDISATLNSSQEVPAPLVASTGTGTLTGSYDAGSNTLQYNVSWTGLTAMASAAHFHGPALPGATALPVITFTLNNNGVAGNATGTATLTDDQESDLLAGRWYVNVHTPNNPPGEIRAQVSATR